MTNDYQVPEVESVEVIAAQPKRADMKCLDVLRATTDSVVEDQVFIIKVLFKESPPITSMGLELYVGDQIIPKYWSLEKGIFFKVIEPEFLEKNAGSDISFATPDGERVATGIKLEVPQSDSDLDPDALLPTQDEVIGRKQR